MDVWDALVAAGLLMLAAGVGVWLGVGQALTTVGVLLTVVGVAGARGDS